jgi:hypothetical protein
MDGNAHFARDRELADIFARHYREGILEVRTPARDYATHFEQYENPYEGGPLIEVIIPRSEVERLNALSAKVAS